MDRVFTCTQMINNCLFAMSRTLCPFNISRTISLGIFLSSLPLGVVCILSHHILDTSIQFTLVIHLHNYSTVNYF